MTITTASVGETTHRSWPFAAATEPGSVMSTAIGMVRAGLGITVLPPMAVQSDTTPDLGSRPVDDPGFIRSIAVVTKADRSLSPAAVAFVEVLRATVDHRRLF